jgi:uncharacterized protein
MAVTLPLLPLVIGIAFGVAIERAGLGSARKLAGQFYLTDLTVFKVMFSAIVTAMLGAFWLDRIGLVSLASIAMPETYLRPQLAGGAVFGAGFALAGLCPGTSCVAAASGRGDGVAVAGGLFFGVLVTGLCFAPLQDFYDSSAHGAWALPQLLHVSYGVVVFAVVLTALAGFAAAERIESSAPRVVGPTPGLTRSAPRGPHIWLALAALVLSAAAAVAPSAPRRAPVASTGAKPALFKPASGC